MALASLLMTRRWAERGTESEKGTLVFLLGRRYACRTLAVLRGSPNMILLPDGVSRHWEDRQRDKLAEAWRRYEEQRDEESRNEYQQTLKIFADAVLRGKMPED
jgi:hypothetical protein